jgi:class 3 adenylate cyclase
MALEDDLESEVGTIFKTAWTERDGQVVPDPASLKLGNDAIKLTGTVLYADLSDSTVMVDSRTPQFAAEVYKAFLHCAAKVIKHFCGTITAYDGDRVMAVYLGDAKNTSAVKTALKLNWVRQNIIQPAINKQYTTDFVLRHVVGIDTAELYIARTGVRGDNDLVWVGRAANWAAKLAALDHSYPTWITAAIYNNMNDQVKFAEGVNMWQNRTWTQMNSASIYCSTYHWAL